MSSEYFPEIFGFPAQDIALFNTSVWNGYTPKFGLGLGREYLIECLRYRASSHSAPLQFESGSSRVESEFAAVEPLV